MVTRVSIELVQIISIFFGVASGLIGGIITYRRWSKSLSLKRADYVHELCNRIRTNKLISDAIYIIDYSSNWYTRDFHSSGLSDKDDETPSIEAKIDYALTYFSYICYLYLKQIIFEEDFVFFKYHIHRICQNKQVINYLYNIYHFSDKFNLECSFHYLIEYAKNNRLLDLDFFDKESCTTGKYPQYLNF